MKVAIMQPYFMPYFGYFQLINAVDKFIVYDDVNFIKQGWINRNKILLNGKDFVFTIQLKDASSFKLIKDTEIHEQFYNNWKNKFYITLEQAYKKAPHFDTVFQIIKNTLESECINISKLAVNSLKSICSYLDIRTTFLDSSIIYHNTNLSAQSRIIDICKQENASTYINLEGGMKLYSKADFAMSNLTLNFISPKPIIYNQFKHEFVPGLSIIDVMMFNTPLQIKEMLNQYELI